MDQKHSAKCIFELQFENGDVYTYLRWIDDLKWLQLRRFVFRQSDKLDISLQRSPLIHNWINLPQDIRASCF